MHAALTSRAHAARAYACLKQQSIILHSYVGHCFYIWSTPFIYQCYINIWSAPYIYGALHLDMEHSICIWSAPYIYTKHSIYYIQCSIYIWSTLYSIQCSIYIWSAPYINRVLHLYMERSIYIHLLYTVLHLYMEHFVHIWRGFGNFDTNGYAHSSFTRILTHLNNGSSPAHYQG